MTLLCDLSYNGSKVEDRKTMMLFMDDDPDRCKKFRRKIPSATIVNDAAGTIDLISQQDSIDCLFLDHDLEGRRYVCSDDDDCGMEVVRWLENNDRTANIGQVVVHSHNENAAKEMNRRLLAAGYKSRLVPFWTLVGGRYDYDF